MIVMFTQITPTNTKDNKLMVKCIVNQALILYVMNLRRNRAAAILDLIAERAEMRRTDKEYR